MSEPTPTQAELPALVARALALVETRLSGGEVGSGLYDSVRSQLLWVQQALSAGEPPDRAQADKLLLGVYAAREFEAADPELADLLFGIQYLFVRRWPPSDGAELRRRFQKRLNAVARQYSVVGMVCLVTGALMAFLAFATHTWIVGQIFFLLLALVGVVSFGWLGYLVITASARHHSLLEALEHHPERIGRIYLVATRYTSHMAMRAVVDVPEAEHLPTSGMLSIVITIKDATPAMIRLGTNRETVRVQRNEVLTLLDWLRAKAPAAEGPPPQLQRG